MKKPTPWPPIEPPAPRSLRQLQLSFAEAITKPFVFLPGGEGFQTATDDYPTAVSATMIPRPDKNMTGADRLATYNCQYWFRLFTTLQKELPLVNYLIGEEDLNKMATAYLSRFPSVSYDLRRLTDRLGLFLEEDQTYGLKILQQAARLDRLHILSFDAPSAPPLDGSENHTCLISKPLSFQPSWFLFTEDWDLVKLRQSLKNRKETDDPYDPCPQHGFWAVWRADSGVVEEELGPLQYRLLCFLNQGKSVAEALSILTASLEPAAAAFLSENLQSWFAVWTARGWLCKKL